MNMNDKKVRKIVAVIILLVIVAMIGTMIIPYLIVQSTGEIGEKTMGEWLPAEKMNYQFS